MKISTEIREMLEGLIRQIAVAIRNITMYTIDHPAAQQSISNSLSTLSEILKEKKEMTLSIVEGRLLANEVILSDTIPLFQRFAGDLRNRNISSITFRQGIQMNEMVGFIQSMMLKPEVVAERGGFSRLLEEKGISNIKVNEIQYSRIGKAQELRDDTIITEFLLGKITDLGRDQDRLLTEIVDNPKRLRSLVERVSTGMQGPEEALDPAAKAGVFAKSLEHIINELLIGRPEGWLQFKKNLAQMVVGLDLSTQAELLKRTIHVEGKEEDIANLFSSEYSDELLADLIAHEYTRNDADPSQTKRFVKKILPDSERRKQLLPEVEKKLEEYGISKEEFMETLKEDPWEEPKFEEEARRFLDKGSLTLGDVQKAPGLIQELISQGNTGDARKAINKFFNGLNHPDLQIREAISRSSKELIEFISSFDAKGEIESKVEAFLSKKIKSESSPEVFLPMVDSLVEIAKARIKEGREKDGFNLMESIMSQIEEKGLDSKELERKHKELHSSIYTDELLARQIDLLREGMDSEKRETFKSIERFGSKGIEELISALADEPQMSKRMRLIKALIEMGEKAKEPLKKVLQDERWYLVRNAVHILGEIGGEEEIDSLGTMLKHNDSRVRREAVQALSNISSLKAYNLIIAALEDKDGSVQTKAIDALLAGGSEKGVPKLMELAKKGGSLGTKDTKLRVKAIKALGTIRSVRAVPLLVDLVMKKGFLGKAEADEIRTSAVVALKTIGGDKALKSLKKLAKSDSSNAVRKLSTEAVNELEGRQ